MASQQRAFNRQRGQRAAVVRAARNGGMDVLLSHPPQVNGLELRHSTTMRFITNAAFTGNITFQNLLDTYCFATSTTAVANVFQTVKVRRVQLWAVPALGTATSVSLEYSGITAGATGDQGLHTDTSMGIQPAHVVARPNVKSLASNYQLNSAAFAFALTVPTGTVVDVELSFRGQLGTASTACQNAAVAATASAFYLRGLDGLAAATTKFTPEFGFAII
jgi:hypothetical protein